MAPNYSLIVSTTFMEHFRRDTVYKPGFSCFTLNAVTSEIVSNLTTKLGNKSELNLVVIRNLSYTLTLNIRNVFNKVVRLNFSHR